MKISKQFKEQYGSFANEIHRLLCDKNVKVIERNPEWKCSMFGVDFEEHLPRLKKGQLGCFYSDDNRVYFALNMGKRLGYFVFYQRYVNKGDVFCFQCIEEVSEFFLSDQLTVADISRVYRYKGETLFHKLNRIVDLYRE